MEESIVENKSQEKTSWHEFLRFAFIALLIVVPIRVFIVEPFVVSGNSMVPTFENNNYLIIDKISYKLNNPKRNDVVIFIYPDPNLDNPKKFFIKRIIGLPGETLDINGSIIFIKNQENPEGFMLEEPYVKNIANNITHVELKSDEYFVMGDNRSASSDSRYWGPLKRKFITGRTLLRLLPIKNIDVFPGQYKLSE